MNIYCKWRRLANTVAFLTLLVSISFSTNAIIVVSSELSEVAQGRFDITNHGPQDFIQTDLLSQVGTLNTLLASVLIDETKNGERFQLSSTLEANWIDENSGNVFFDDLGWITENVQNGSVCVCGTGWKYKFIAESDGVFNVDWDVVANQMNTRDFGLGFQLTWLANGSFVDSTFIDISSSDNTMRSFTAGNEYEVWIGSNSNIAGGIASRTSLVDASFDWNIEEFGVVSVATPSNFAIIIIGLIMLSIKRKFAEPSI